MSQLSQQQKLSDLRALMAKHGLDGLMVPRTDEYQGEYVPECAERLAWLTGFTGSAGLALVLTDKACVMSDGRYTIQLAAQVDGNLYERVNSQEVKPEEWLKESLSEGAVLGYDPKLHTPAQIEAKEKEGIKLKAIDENLIDLIWQDKPEAPCAPVSLFPDDIAGRSAAEKVQLIQEGLKEEKADAVILTLSDSIAWLLNIRGHDIPFIPVALSYAIVPRAGHVKWFINLEKITDEVRQALTEHVEFLSEEKLSGALDDLSNNKVWFDPRRSSVWFKNQLGNILEKDDPCILPRACKTQAEQDAMKQAHIRDGVALVKFLKWFDTQNEPIDELKVETKLESFRAEAPEFKEPSFSTIAGYGANGAIVHYRADETSNQQIEQGSLLLLDSGAQYGDGTTDITRTIGVGNVPQKMKEHFTIVLKGHIALATAKFKAGTTGQELDEITRAPLIENDINYAHGTGHGVGCYLSVHEEATNISPRSEEAMQVGMIVSNEPGCYEEGSHGIRVENLILCKQGEDELYFETITLAPMDKNLIIKELLNDFEIEWMNNYHADVYKTLAPLLTSDLADWLKEATAEI